MDVHSRVGSSLSNCIDLRVPQAYIFRTRLPFAYLGAALYHLSQITVCPVTLYCCSSICFPLYPASLRPDSICCLLLSGYFYPVCHYSAIIYHHYSEDLCGRPTEQRNVSDIAQGEVPYRLASDWQWQSAKRVGWPHKQLTTRCVPCP